MICPKLPGLAVACQSFYRLLTRRKSITYSLQAETKLDKCLSTIDLTFLGVGCTLGSGIYVVIGQVAKSVAGPSVVLSFLIAALASVLAGLSYAEFGARVPRAGSAYVYSYVTVGEIWAFVIGWNLVLEYVIGSASVARATSTYIDAMTHHAMSNYLTEHAPINVPSLSPYPDFLAFGLCILLSVVLCLGMRESSLINNIFTIINLFVICYIIICGLFKVDGHNWNIPYEEVPDHEVNGIGGFFPFGILGMTSGAGTCFYCFVGFDIIATAGEETVNPQKAIPIAITSCLIISSIAYILPSIILTLMVPYFSLDPLAPLPSAFDLVGWYVAAYIIDVGAICSLATCLLTSICGMPRVVYAMASDGLVFKFLAYVNTKFQTPVIATMVTGTFTGLMALLFNLRDLVDMMSIGTLLAYTLVSVCVLLLRYEYAETGGDVVSSPAPASCRALLVELFVPKTNSPTKQTFCIMKICLVVEALTTIWSGLVVLYLSRELYLATWWAILLLTIPLVFMVFALVVMWRQPETDTSNLSFRVPLIPFVPLLSMILNIYLMLNLSAATWLRFFIWMMAGFLIYFLYGIRHNGLHIQDKDSYIELSGSNGSIAPANSDGVGTAGANSVITTTEKVDLSDKVDLVPPKENE